jgi:hypothetical protein
MVRGGCVCGILLLAGLTLGGSKSRREVVPGTVTKPAQAGQGMVSSAHPLATGAGI